MQFVKEEIFLGVLLSTIVVLVLIVFFAVLMLLYQKKIRERQKDIFESVIATEEKERMRIAKDLHDSLGASLSAIKLHFGSVKEEVRDSDKAQLIYKMLNEACAEVRSISHQMMPHILLSEGLIEAVRQFCKPLQTISNLKFELIILGVENRIKDQGHELLIYRTIQELLNNSLKHSQATELLLQMSISDGRLTIVIEDNGQGFDTSMLEKSTGFGLKNIMLRAKYMKGTINIESESGKGVSIVMNVPF